MTKMKENLIAIGLTLLLTFGVIAFIGHGNANLATDLLGERKQQTKNVADLNFVYSASGGKLFLNRSIDNVASISFEIMYDKSKVKISRDSFDSKYNLSFAKDSSGNSYDVILQPVGNLNESDVLLKINNLTKEQFDKINIGHIQVLDNNGNVMDLTSTK